MPRAPRTSSESGLYHVTMRGNAKADIFESEEQRLHFLDLLSRYKTECHFDVIAWCLMDNHVHLVLDAHDSDLSAALQRLATAYAVYYNKAEDRVGHLFQSPFRSKPIEYEEQLVNTVRYVHANPQRARICEAARYRWSSYGEYAGEPWLVSTAMVLGITGDAESLLNEPADPDYVVRDTRNRLVLTDEQARLLIARELGIRSCNDVSRMPKRDRNQVIVETARLHMPVGQMARIFGLGERTVYRIIRNASKERERHMVPLHTGKAVLSKGV